MTFTYCNTATLKIEYLDAFKNSLKIHPQFKTVDIFFQCVEFLDVLGCYFLNKQPIKANTELWTMYKL